MKLQSCIIILTTCVAFSCQSEIQNGSQSIERVGEEDSTKKTIDTFNLTFSQHIKLYSTKNVYQDTSLNTITDSLNLAIYYSINGLNEIDSIYKEYKRLSGISNDVVHNEKMKSCFASADTATHPAIDIKSNKHKLWYCYYHFQFRLGFYTAQLQSEIEKLNRKTNNH